MDRVQSGYDADSNVLYKNNLVNGSFSELFSASNGTAPNAQYDALNRLLGYMRGSLSSSGSSGSQLDQVLSPSKTQSWALDAVGNWLAFNDSVAGNQTRTNNARNEISSISGGGASATPTFDNDGNMTQDEQGHKLVVDAWDRIVKVEDASGNVLESDTYDALGRRISITNASTGVTTDLFYSGPNVIEERQGSTVTTQYVWGLGGANQLVLRDDNSTGGNLGLTGSGLGRRLFIEQDTNLSVTSLTDTSGNVVQRIVYDPYGAQTILDANWNVVPPANDTVGMLYGFQAMRRDPISGLLKSFTRDYDVYLGRWVEQDPTGSIYVDGSNLYQAMDSNPGKYVDPTGLSVSWWDVAKDAFGFGDDGAAGKVWSGFGEGAKGGASIAANTITHGLTDKAGITDSDQYQGPDYAGSRAAAGVAQQAFDAAALGALGRGLQALRGCEYGNFLNNLARAGQLGLGAWNVYQGGKGVYQGYQDINCDGWTGATEMLLGALQAWMGLKGIRGAASPGRCFVAGTQVVLQPAIQEAESLAWWQDYRYWIGALAVAGPLGYVLAQRAIGGRSETEDDRLPDELDGETLEPAWVPLIPAAWMVARVRNLQSFRERLILGIRAEFAMEVLDARR